MNDYNEWLKRIVVDPGVKGGYPVFPGSRVTLQQVVGLARQGATYSYLFSEFPFLTTQDIRYAALYLKQDEAK